MKRTRALSRLRASCVGLTSFFFSGKNSKCRSASGSLRRRWRWTSRRRSRCASSAGRTGAQRIASCCASGRGEGIPGDACCAPFARLWAFSHPTYYLFLHLAHRWMFPTGEGDEYIMARKQGA